jgi:hypothetical protein
VDVLQPLAHRGAELLEQVVEPHDLDAFPVEAPAAANRAPAARRRCMTGTRRACRKPARP